MSSWPSREAIWTRPSRRRRRAPEAAGDLPALRSHVAAAVEKIAAGNVDVGLESFVDAIGGPGVWRGLPAAAQQELRDNARTPLGQVNEQRQPYTRADAEGIRVPTLFIGGTDTPGMLPVVLHALATHVPGARVELLPNTTHMMFEQDPVRFSTVVLDFLATDCSLKPR